VTNPRDIESMTPAIQNGKAMPNGAHKSEKQLHHQKFLEITLDTPLKALSRFFEWNSAAVVTERDEEQNLRPVAVVTKVDLLTWLVKQGKIAA